MPIGEFEDLISLKKDVVKGKIQRCKYCNSQFGFIKIGGGLWDITWEEISKISNSTDYKEFLELFGYIEIIKRPELFDKLYTYFLHEKNLKEKLNTPH
jgi:hypothetical protein